jgi:hypothetical protein
MYLLNTDYVEPAELTGYAREALKDLAVNKFQLARWLPDKPIDDIDYRFTKGGEGLIDAATFRNYDTPSRFGSRPGTARVSGELPPVSRQIRLGEYDRLRLRKAGPDAVVNQAFNDGKRMTEAVAARLELARGEALTTGKVVIAEGGVVATADYGRNAGHTVTAGVLWTSANLATMTPLTNMIAWADTYETNTGQRPEAALTSRQELRLMTRCAEIINAIKGSTVGATRVSMAELADLLESEGLPMPQVYEAKVNVNKSATRILAANKFLFLNAPDESAEENDLGATLWGTTAESMEAEYAIEEAEWPGIVAGVYKSPNPIALYTNAVGIGLPVMANPDLSFAATVA